MQSIISRLSVPHAFRALAPKRGLAEAAAAAAPLKQTVLHDTHVAIGGKMVPFAGYSMPVQYPDGIKDSHLFVRSSSGLFDVSHMGQITLHGADRVKFLEQLVVADVAAIPEHSSQLSVMTLPNGGILDDTIISNLGGHLGMVINAGCKDKDLAHIRQWLADSKAKGMDVDLEVIDDFELLALQGPLSMSVMERLVPGFDFKGMNFMTNSSINILGAQCHVTRCGYTGEDGFEISVPAGKTVELFEVLTAQEEVRPVGLGARDSLRLEAGLCLYGNDIDDSISPVEAALTWTIGKRRRAEGGFLGSEVVQSHLSDGIERRRMGFVMGKGAPARGGEDIMNESGEVVGKVTSGGFSPCLGKGIGMGYALKPFNKSGTQLKVKVRSKVNDITVQKLPLVPSNYYTAP